MEHTRLRDRAKAAGTRAFGPGWHVDGWTVAPGRIELIGNHIDYNGGPVLAGAIDRVVVIASGPIGNASVVQLIAADVRGGVATCTPAELVDWHSGPKDRGPVVYLKGIIASLLERSIPIRTGVGLAVAGNIPPGFGMSSSAALCVASILALTADDIPPYELVAIAREAEHRAGALVGAMDQSASVAGGVIRFDGRDNSFERIEPDLGRYVFAVADSGVKRSLRTSAYGTRVKESHEALSLLNAAYGFDLPNLAALVPHWNDVRGNIDQHLSPTLLARVRHVVTETMRVNEAERAVRDNNWVRFGELMDESGRSSAADYDISHPVVEELVAHIRKQPGVIGARMMGGGNGGPALVLLEQERLEDVKASLASFYARHPIQQPDRAFHACRFGPGAHRETV